MTSTGYELLAAIRANPADDGLRLVFADFLDETGQPAMARLFRRGATRTFPHDRARVAFAFHALRSRGWFARMNFWCCQSCGWSAVPREYDDGNVVFYHRQDADSFLPGGDLCRRLYLAHRGDSPTVLVVLSAAGLAADWSGDPAARIKVCPR